MYHYSILFSSVSSWPPFYHLCWDISTFNYCYDQRLLTLSARKETGLLANCLIWTILNWFETIFEELQYLTFLELLVFFIGWVSDPVLVWVVLFIYFLNSLLSSLWPLLSWWAYPCATCLRVPYTFWLRFRACSHQQAVYILLPLILFLGPNLCIVIWYGSVLVEFGWMILILTCIFVHCLRHNFLLLYIVPWFLIVWLLFSLLDTSWSLISWWITSMFL